jgi:hypothetical protein
MRRTVVGAVIFALGLITGAWAWRFILIDKCLDAGGRWDYTRSICEGSRGGE